MENGYTDANGQRQSYTLNADGTATDASGKVHGKPSATQNDAANSEPQNEGSNVNEILNQTSNARNGGAIEAATLEFAAASGLKESGPASTLKNIGRLETVAGVIGKGLGIVAAYEHGSKAMEAFKNGDNINGFIGVGKVALDGFFIFAKMSNPAVFVGSLVYTIADLSSVLEVQRN